ncbi:hypothetical protein MTR_0125s0010 [Medicago truncatula]|uniref:Uncharacterized protein n=1 Tax=Medicago truncatula TaxID=3880 RepID=A0A072TI96_MEDTR|nr:hypothetical protein MTR_0125s0010 [Medicago truncatula]
MRYSPPLALITLRYRSTSDIKSLVSSLTVDHRNSQYGKDVWDVVTNRRFQPQVIANGVSQDKPKADWSDDEKNKFQYDLKAQNTTHIFS